ncbi:ankyrin repeat domain-containing protein 54 [Condylostylus longicornis]|uniref:ankyrin repeat domain-containing protein 54 n=1 Tax=Condylostylus longicornis TaxID=2530218 RepID=UPI00244E0FFB|nr:ankyrin repeat domain-containing protein 54 [Condylostylus longicornis]
MASNDSGVDSSNDSNDANLVMNSNLSNFCVLPKLFDNNKMLQCFALPQPVSSTSTSTENKLQFGSLPPGKFKINSFRRLHSQRNRVKHEISQYKERKLRLAASTCNIELLTNLLKSGVDPNCSDEHKRSPLHLAACRGYTDIVSQLLKYGANPNIVDSLGNTPLHLAVISASSTNFNLVVRILLQQGASVHVIDRSGKNPLELAEGRLRLMRSRCPTPEVIKIIEDMCLLIALILRYFCKQKRDLEDLEGIEERLQNLSTNDQVVNEADSLLASVEKLSIAK